MKLYNRLLENIKNIWGKCRFYKKIIIISIMLVAIFGISIILFIFYSSNEVNNFERYHLIESQIIQDNNAVSISTVQLLTFEDWDNLPLTLIDWYLILNENLSENIKNDIKNSSNIKDYFKNQFYYGQWISWNIQWQPDENKEMQQLFFNNNIFHPNDMSHIILIGYYYYLNGIEKTIEELKYE